MSQTAAATVLGLCLQTPLFGTRQTKSGDASIAMSSTKECTVRAALSRDVAQVAALCTDTFFGGATKLWSGAPVLFVQRRRVLSRVNSQIGERVAEANDSERLVLVAVENVQGSDSIVGMVDVAVHLYDSFTSEFDLAADTMPDGGEFRFEWQPYVTALAVRPDARRRGIARALMQEAESTALSWGYDEAYLEVTEGNERARKFYERIGYRERRGTSSTRQTEMAVRGAGVLRWWVERPVEKFMMSRRVRLSD